jgi:hypothetical protein
MFPVLVISQQAILSKLEAAFTAKVEPELDAEELLKRVTDLLNNDVAISMDCFTVLKTARLYWSFEQYVTVLK